MLLMNIMNPQNYGVLNFSATELFFPKESEKLIVNHGTHLRNTGWGKEFVIRIQGGKWDNSNVTGSFQNHPGKKGFWLSGSNIQSAFHEFWHCGWTPQVTWLDALDINMDKLTLHAQHATFWLCFDFLCSPPTERSARQAGINVWYTRQLYLLLEINTNTPSSQQECPVNLTDNFSV